MTHAIPLPVVEELTPVPDVMAAVRACRDWPNLLLFDSALRRRSVGRYSFLMADPVETREIAEPHFGDDPFAEISLMLNRLPCDSVPGLPPFQGGLAGLMSYELGRCFERVSAAPHDEFQLPVLAVGLYDWVIAWDHAENRAWIISQGWPEIEADRRVAYAANRIQAVRERLTARTLNSSEHVGETNAVREATTTTMNASSAHASSAGQKTRRPIVAPQFPVAGTRQLTSNFTRENYLQAVARVIEYIRAGDIFQANLTQRLLSPATENPLDLYERLRRVNPAPFAGLICWDDWSVMSASPERFLRVSGRDVETRPIKGTRRRNRGPEADLFTRDELRESQKDQAENVMIVDLLRNDLSRVCEAGSIRVPQLCGVETYETVQHLVSEVRGRLRTDATVWDLFRATSPGGSISGAPKVRAMKIIAELEPTVRGPYCGSLFYAGSNGQTDSNLLIRTFVQREGWLQCGVGGGIVAQSDPVAEYEETLIKAAGMVKALR
jgi:para-aminobenzoate synthetase component I